MLVNKVNMSKHNYYLPNKYIVYLLKNKATMQTKTQLTKCTIMLIKQQFAKQRY